MIKYTYKELQNTKVWSRIRLLSHHGKYKRFTNCKNSKINKILNCCYFSLAFSCCFRCEFWNQLPSTSRKRLKAYTVQRRHRAKINWGVEKIGCFIDVILNYHIWITSGNANMTNPNPDLPHIRNHHTRQTETNWSIHSAVVFFTKNMNRVLQHSNKTH
jgi:hypothetical protein